MIAFYTRIIASLGALTLLAGCCEASYGPGKCMEMNRQHKAMQHLLPHTLPQTLPQSLVDQAETTPMPPAVAFENKSAIAKAAAAAPAQVTQTVLVAKPRENVEYAPFSKAPSVTVKDVQSDTASDKTNTNWLKY